MLLFPFLGVGSDINFQIFPNRATGTFKTYPGEQRSIAFYPAEPLSHNQEVIYYEESRHHHG